MMMMMMMIIIIIFAQVIHFSNITTPSLSISVSSYLHFGTLLNEVLCYLYLVRLLLMDSFHVHRQCN
jgi:hypothetical protein